MPKHFCRYWEYWYQGQTVHLFTILTFWYGTNIGDIHLQETIPASRLWLNSAVWLLVPGAAVWSSLVILFTQTALFTSSKVSKLSTLTDESSKYCFSFILKPFLGRYTYRLHLLAYESSTILILVFCYSVVLSLAPLPQTWLPPAKSESGTQCCIPWFCWLSIPGSWRTNQIL